MCYRYRNVWNPLLHQISLTVLFEGQSSQASAVISFGTTCVMIYYIFFRSVFNQVLFDSNVSCIFLKCHCCEGQIVASFRIWFLRKKRSRFPQTGAATGISSRLLLWLLGNSLKYHVAIRTETEAVKRPGRRRYRPSMHLIIRNDPSLSFCLLNQIYLQVSQ